MSSTNLDLVKVKRIKLDVRERQLVIRGPISPGPKGMFRRQSELYLALHYIGLSWIIRVLRNSNVILETAEDWTGL